jgi:hypothetical protein
MTRPTIGILDVTTQELIVREMNDEEFEQYKIDKAAHEASQVKTEKTA